MGSSDTLYNFFFVNTLGVYFIGVILGILGVVYLYRRDSKIKNRRRVGHIYVSILIYLTIMCIGLVMNGVSHKIKVNAIESELQEKSKEFYKEKGLEFRTYNKDQYKDLIEEVYEKEYQFIEEKYPYTYDIKTLGNILNKGSKGEVVDLYTRLDSEEQRLVLSINQDTLEEFQDVRLAYIESEINNTIKRLGHGQEEELKKDIKLKREELRDRVKGLTYKEDRKYRISKGLMIQLGSIFIAVMFSGIALLRV